ncbi:SgrR family transcriptional regulator [Vibrio clamense]|uniref:SgrR family transcriptional regulator n=1 Tax=Vibrio clamense TaxID=2910254 RepID=UPI003D20570B
MSDLNLLRYYSRLAGLGVEQELKIPLSEVAESFITSPRHARTLLGQMQDCGWLTWLPKAGRNQRSTLLLNLSVDRLKARLATERIHSGQYEKALSILDHDQARFKQLLHTTSGASIREGRLHIQLTYKRRFERLVPHLLHRNSERFLLRQLYSGLVSCNPSGKVCPELAHHWEYDPERLTWTFYLRPSLTFHNDQPIDANTVVTMFARLTQKHENQAELQHVIDIVAPQPHCIVFQLSQPDFGFAGLLADVKYSIQPPSQLFESSIEKVVGSGPFEVVEHSEEKITLKAFERFYGCRALTDQVTIWHLDEKLAGLNLTDSNLDKNALNTEALGESVAQSSGSCEHYVSQTEDIQQASPTLDNAQGIATMSNEQKEGEADNQQSRVEDGCLYLLFNQATSGALSLEQQRYLSTLLHPEKLWEELNQASHQFGAEIAQNLLPEWSHIRRPDSMPTALPHSLSIAVYQHTALEYSADAIVAILNKIGVNVVVNIYSYRELSQKAIDKKLVEEMVLTNINLDDNRHSSAYIGLLSNTVLHHCLGHHHSQWLVEELSRLRADTPLEEYLEQLESISTSIISEYVLLPMFHHRQTLRFKGVLKNVALTNWGWPAIRDVWSVD